jgi:hypothetical protein
MLQFLHGVNMPQLYIYETSCDTRACTHTHIVTCIPIAGQQLSKHIPTEAHAHKNRMSIATDQ